MLATPVSRAWTDYFRAVSCCLTSTFDLHDLPAPSDQFLPSKFSQSPSACRDCAPYTTQQSARHPSRRTAWHQARRRYSAAAPYVQQVHAPKFFAFPWRHFFKCRVSILSGPVRRWSGNFSFMHIRHVVYASQQRYPRRTFLGCITNSQTARRIERTDCNKTIRMLVREFTYGTKVDSCISLLKQE